jgi:hypothetical protein
MAGITYTQRRPGSGIYQFRKRLPKELAGKVAPEHMPQGAPPAATNKRSLWNGCGS